MTENIFLSYRRDDSRGYTNAIYTLLELHFPADSIFMDVDTLVPGSDFVQSLQDAVEACDIFLAIIGSRWENIEDNKGLRRLDNPEDFVRIEIAHALKRGIPVIPVLVDGAQMPFTENLPDNIKDLARRHAFSIGDHMRSDVQRLIKVLERTFERLEKERLEQEKKEAERLAKAQAESEQKAREEEEQKAKAQAEADLKAKKEAERKAREQAEAEQKAREKAEQERKANEQAEAEQKAKEEAEAEQKAVEEKERLALQKAELQDQKKAKAEAERKAKAEAEAKRKAKKEADKKVRALAAAEKKETDNQKRISRQKTKSAAAGQEDRAVSPSPLALNKLPVWAWPVVGVVLILIGYGIFGGLRPTSSGEPGETEVSQDVLVYTNTPASEAISSTPTPEATTIPTAVITVTPTAEPFPGSETINSIDGAVMVYVPSGDFMMGSDFDEPDESPAHIVYLDGFWMYKTEVTNATYRLCVEAGACIMNEWQSEYFNDVAYNDHPVVKISWKNADTYCRWAGGRLPTEAEWEKAARGTDGRTYPWGEGIDDSLANYDGNVGGTSPVGSYPEGASPYGLLDMAGNVGEYVSDWYDSGYYALSPAENPAGPDDGLERVYRGGVWKSSENNIRVTKRGTAFPREWDFEIFGFRCATSQQP